MSRSRSWTFTVNNYTPETYEAIKAIDCKYLVVGREIGDSGTPHLQGYIVFTSAAKLHQVKAKIPQNPHLEVAKGNSSQNFDYCTKEDEEFFEKGERPLTAKEKGDTEKKRYERAWEQAKAGEIDEIDADIRMRLYGTIKRIRADYQQVPQSLEQLDFWWYFGASGTGKSRAAREENPGYYIKNKNKWWDGYVDQPCVIIEEWFPDVVSGLQQMLKEWCDHHPFAAETKGSATSIRPPKIIITSNYTLEECFGSDRSGLYEPLARRLKVREF